MQLNWFDQLVSTFNPQAGVRRGQARMALDVLRKYEAATTGRRASGWTAGAGSANAEVHSSLATVRNRASQMVRDNEYAKAAVRALATHIVGTGITVAPKLRAERDSWVTWCNGECDAQGELDLPGMMRLAAMAWKERGEAILRRRWRRTADGLVVPMQIQLMEGDHLDHSKTGILENGNPCITGVEFDSLGRRTAYWLFPEHPGETIAMRRTPDSRRVPASEIIHLYRKDRISQVRGMPELATSLMRLRDLDGYEEAELVRKKIEACFTAFVTTDEPRTTVGDLQKEQPTGRVVEKVSPGLIKYLRVGENVSFGTPAAVGGYGDYTQSQLHAIAAGAGVTYAQLTGDTSRSNYTSHRAGLREFYAHIEQEQWLTFIPMLVRPVRRWWREAAQVAGLQLGDQPDDITCPAKAMVDPLKDVMAEKEEIRGGLTTLYEGWRRRGLNPDDVLDELVRIKQALAEKGLVLDIDAAVSELKLSPAQLLAAESQENQQ